MRKRYKYDPETGRMVEVTNTAPAEGPGKGPCIWPDTQGYRSPVTGRWIEGRAARREDLRRHGCVDAREFGWGRRD